MATTGKYPSNYTNIDFNQWMENMDINIEKQSPDVEPMLMVFERLYDLIIDTRNEQQ